MKKLNNKGWGLSSLIVFMVVFFVFLIVFTVLAYKSGVETGSQNPYMSSDNTN